MKKLSTRFFTLIAMLTFLGLAYPLRTSGQGIEVVPTPLYRFEVSYWDGGHLLTGYYQEGPANGYSYDPIPYPSVDGLGIYVPPPGYVPGANSGLVPLHRWTVIQDGWRTHYYYSTYYTEQPSDRYYNGIAGYVYPPGTESIFVPGTIQGVFPLHQLSVFYSSDLGFWNGYGGFAVPGNQYFELPPDRSGRSSYGYQGIICALPPANNSLYAKPFGPSGGGGSGGENSGCNPPSSSLNACQHNGGWWDYDLCQCQY